MGVIPKKTTPLTKFVRTGEGVLVFAFNLAMLIVPIVSSALSPEEAVKWAGIVNGVAVISRTGLKIVAQVSKTTGIEPEQIGDVGTQVIDADAAIVGSNGGGPGNVIVPADAAVPGPGAAPDSPDSTVSDDEEFSSVPPAADDEDDGMALEPASHDQTDLPDTVGAGVSGVPDPIVINGGGPVS